MEPKVYQTRSQTKQMVRAFSNMLDEIHLLHDQDVKATRIIDLFKMIKNTPIIYYNEKIYACFNPKVSELIFQLEDEITRNGSISQQKQELLAFLHNCL